MLDQPLVSIGLPTYNRASSLRRAIASALAQDYRNIELIISDNASMDETQAVCLEASRNDGRIKYLRQSENQGATANFREVLARSHGEFFMWLADDDWLDRTYVVKCVATLRANPDYALVGGKTRYYNGEHLVLEETGINLVEDSGVRRVLMYYSQVAGNGIFYGVMRREQIAGVSIQETFGGDWLLVADLAFMGKVVTLGEVVIHRSIDGVSRDLKKLALNSGLGGLIGTSPHLKIAVSAYEHIAWKSPIYKPLKPSTRLILGCRSFITILRHCVIPQWYGKANAKISKSHPRIKNLVKTVRNKLMEAL